ncbi:chitinase [Sessilibacter corallicola]|uniref:chitinase n=1 Tax=Sessilibacter corallicola TaxID=2904075 RepID=UPI001E2C4CA1|nr:chitinase [Sessilibacter corallicola]MCE2027186.1 chitinase [Sessilibacter corallicola]
MTVFDDNGEFVISQDVFKNMFPNRSALYTYDGLIEAVEVFESQLIGSTMELTLTNILAFLANAAHETTGDGSDSNTYTRGLYFANEGGEYVEELCAHNPEDQVWCTGYGLTPDGKQSYYGRGALQISYAFNYEKARDSIPNSDEDIYQNPKAVAQVPYLGWATALWFWCTASNNKPSCSDVILQKWQPSENDQQKGRVNTTFANRMGVVTNIINGGIEAGNWNPSAGEVVPIRALESVQNKQAINRQQYYQYFSENYFSGRVQTMTEEEYGINQAASMANFNY